MSSTSKTTCVSTSSWRPSWFSQFPPTPRVAAAAADDETEGGGWRSGGGLGRRVRVRVRRRPMPCLETNKYC